MHLIEAKKLVEKQVVNLYKKHAFSALQVARYLNLANPRQLFVKKAVSDFQSFILFNL